MKLDKERSDEKGPVQVALLVDTQPTDDKPYIVTPLQDQTVIEGDDVTLKAEFNGKAPLEFSWFKDEIALIESPRIHEEVDGGWAILHLKNVKIEDEAEYVCIAANDAGGCETVAELLVDGKLCSWKLKRMLLFRVLRLQ